MYPHSGATGDISVACITSQRKLIHTDESVIKDQGKGATRGVTVSKSAFLACNQWYCAGSSLAWGLNVWAVACGTCRGILRVLRFPPLLHRFKGSANKIKLQ